jgi:hypothetical protein
MLKMYKVAYLSNSWNYDCSTDYSNSRICYNHAVSS